MLDATDVGHRVVVRRYAGVEREGRRLMTDVLGELIAADGRQLVVRSRDGRVHTVPLTAVAAAKRVPPRQVTRHEIVAAELAGDRTWPAPVHERLGDWLLRAAGGFSNRANTALPVGDPGRPLGEAVDAVEEWYRARGLNPGINVPLPLAADVDAELDRRGWATTYRTVMMASDLHSMAAPPGGALPPVTLRPRPSTEFLAVVAGNKGGLPEAAAHVLFSPERVRFAEVYDPDGALVAMARGALDPSGHWLNLSLIEVAAGARRRGLASRVITTLAGWGRHLGAQRGFLQVVAGNAPAVALYRKLGFTDHHVYLTRRADPAG